MGLTLVAYLRGAEARAAGAVEATTVAAAAGMAGALWLAAVAAVGASVVAAASAAAAAVVGRGAVVAAAGLGPGLDPPVGGGEERHSRGMKLCPPHVLTLPGPEKGRR